MIGTRSSSKLTWLFTVCILIVSLTTSCSAGAGSQAQSHTSSAAALNSSDRSSAEIAKPAQSDKQTKPTDGKPLKKAVQGLAVEQPTVPPAGDPNLAGSSFDHGEPGRSTGKRTGATRSGIAEPSTCAEPGRRSKFGGRTTGGSAGARFLLADVGRQAFPALRDGRATGIDQLLGYLVHPLQG